jgi:hypothetical protein
MRTLYLLSFGAFAAGCSSCGGPQEPELEPATHEEPAVTYEVHEWGLVRGTAADTVMLSSAHAEPLAVPVAKPILYFHRRGEGALVVDVTANIVNGRIVESWPVLGPVTGARVSWPSVTIQEGHCRGSRYPGLAEDPCSRVTDGCEAATLANFETDDASCLFWPRPPDDDGPTQAWNHLFYRGEVAGPVRFPLALEPQADGSLGVTASARVPGKIIRVLRGNGTGVSDGVAVVDPPQPGQRLVVPAPTGAMTSGVNALGESLREAGLTEPEIEAFHRAWDTVIFGNAPLSAAPAAMPVAVSTTVPPAAPATPSRTILYVLPLSSVEALATLSFSPPPTAVRRAIVAWIDEAP